MGVTIIKKTSSNKTTYAPNRSIQYIVVHYTAGVYSYKGVARNCAGFFANQANASADYIVDDEEIVQYNPDPSNRYCWSVGGSNLGTKGGSCYGKCTNYNSVSIEMCCQNSSGNMTYANDPRYTLTAATVENCRRLVKHLMETYKIPITRVIRHYDVTGKLCPGVIGWNEDSGDTSKWKSFIASLSGSNSTPSSSSTASTSTTTKTTDTVKVTKITAGVKLKFPCAIRVHNKLCIFAEPNVKSKVIGNCPIGSYTITKEHLNGGVRYGNLKAGGWIVLTGNASVVETVHASSTSKNTTTVNTPTKKKLNTAELANAIIRGEYGSGEARFEKLAKEGYTDAEVKAAQNKVNEILLGNPKAAPKKSTKQLAADIISGEYGCGEARFKKLAKEGYTEAEINAAQNLVNELLK